MKPRYVADLDATFDMLGICEMQCRKRDGRWKVRVLVRDGRCSTTEHSAEDSDLQAALGQVLDQAGRLRGCWS